MVGKNNEQSTDRFNQKEPNSSSEPSKTVNHSRNSDEPDESQKWFESGLKCLENHHYKEAIQFLSKVVRVEPDNLIAYEKLTIAKSIQADIDSVEEFVAIGRDCIKHEDWAGAAEELRSALSIVPDHEEAIRLLAVVTPNLKETQRLEKVSDASAKSSPSEPEKKQPQRVHSPESDSEFSKPYRTESAPREHFDVDDLNVIEMDISGDSGAIDKRLNDAILQYESGDLKGAQEALLLLKQKHEDHPQIDYYLRIIESKFEDTKTSQDQETVERLLKEGMDELEGNNIPNAVRKFEEAIRIKPDFEQARSMLNRANSMKTGKSKVVRTQEADRPSSVAKTVPVQSKPAVGNSSNTTFRIVIASVVAIVLSALAYFILVALPNLKADNLMKQAKLLISENREADALKKLTEYLMIKPKNVDALLLAGNTAQKTALYSESIQYFTEASTLDPQNMSIVLSLGETYLKANQLEAAEKTLTKATGNPALAKKAYLSLGITLKTMNKKESAVEALRKALEVDPNSPHAHYELGRILEDKSAPETAEVEYLAAIEKDPKFTDAFEALGTYYLNLEKPDQAIEILNQPLMWLKTSRPNETEIINRIRILLGQAHYNKGEFDTAIEQYNKVLLLSDDLTASLELGRAYYRQNKDQAAIVAWQKSLKLDPNNGDIHFRIARAHHRLSDYAAAIEYYNNAIRLDPTHSQAFANLGFVYHALGKIAQARDAWEKSVKLNSNQPHIMNELKKLQGDKVIPED